MRAVIPIALALLVAVSCSTKRVANQRNTPHVPRNQAAEQVERVIPMRTAPAKACAKDAGEYESENGDGYDWGHDRPDNTKHGSFVSRQQVPLRK